MNNNLLAKIKSQALLFLMSLIFAFSLAQILTDVFHFDITIGQNFFRTFVTLLSFTILFFNSYTTIATLGVVIVGSLVILLTPLRDSDWFLNLTETMTARLQAAGVLGNRFLADGFTFVGNINTTLTATERDSWAFLGSLVLFGFTFLIFLMIQKVRTFWFPLVLLILLLSLTFYVPNPSTLLWLIPMGIVAILMILLSSGHLLDLLRKKSGGKHLLAASGQMAIAVVLALALAVAATGVLSYSKIYSPYWQGIVDDLITLFPDSLQPPLTISPFSLGEDGYYPLGDRLGGPVTLEDSHVAEVTGNVPGLLKVQSSDTYDGLRWTRLVNNPNYRYSSPFNGGAENEVFNSYRDQAFFNLLPAAVASRVYTNYAYDLTPLRQGTQLVSHSGTPTDLVSSREEALLFYFNQAGTVYARTIFDNQHSYHVETYDIDAGSLGFGQSTSPTLSSLDQAAAAFQGTLPNQANAYYNYLQLPDNTDYQAGGYVYDLAQEITAGSTGEYTRVQALLDYLANNPDFHYTMSPEAPPENTDFVTYFLQTREGYCTYYASAMTMLARLNGIPARYVEGYALSGTNQREIGAGDTVYINSNNAHAWTEVYLTGLGWVAVDPTPGGLNGEGLQEPEPTPSPSPSPTPPPTTTTTTAPTDQSPTTTPAEPTTTPATTTSQTTPQEDGGISRIITSILFILLGLALLVLLAWLYYKKRVQHIANLHDRAWLAGKIPDTNRRAVFYWDELLNLHRLQSEFSLAPSLTEREIASYLTQAEAKLGDAGGAGDSSADTGAAESTVDKSTTQETTNGATADERSADPDALYKPGHEVPETPTTSEAETSAEGSGWAALAEIVAEARYRGQAMPAERLDPLAEAFDQAEADLRKELGEAAYLRKRILPPTQGTIPSP